jgi:uncharacterized protein YndB with AHSA1/START domain
MSKLTITVLVNTNLANAWKIHTLPEYIKKWNCASDDWECPASINNLEVGGKFVSTMRAKDGSASFDFGGTYTRVEKNKEIFYILDDGREIEIFFEEVDKTVRVTINFDPENQSSIDLQQSGWQSILNNYKKICETEDGR